MLVRIEETCRLGLRILHMLVRNEETCWSRLRKLHMLVRIEKLYIKVIEFQKCTQRALFCTAVDSSLLRLILYVYKHFLVILDCSLLSIPDLE